MNDDLAPGLQRRETHTYDLSEELFEFQERIQQSAETYSTITGITGTSLRVIFCVLHTHYNDYIEAFLKRNCNERQKSNLSVQISGAFCDYRVARSTRYACITCIRKILREIDLDPKLVNAIKFIDEKEKRDNILGQIYDCSTEGSQRVKERLDKWVMLIREGTKNKSPWSICNIMSFYVSKCLRNLDIVLHE